MNIKDLNIEVYNKSTNELWYLTDVNCNNYKTYLYITTKDNITKELILHYYNICKFYKYVYNNYIWNNVSLVIYIIDTITIQIDYKHLNNILSYLDYKFPMYLI